MTYRELSEWIQQMTPVQLDSTVTVHLGEEDEFYPVDHGELTNDQEEDRLDDGHPYLVVFNETAENLTRKSSSPGDCHEVGGCL